MTFQEILTILADKTKTDYQKAADLHAALEINAKPPYSQVEAKKPRKTRTTKPKPPTTPHTSLQSISSNHDNEA